MGLDFDKEEEETFSRYRAYGQPVFSDVTALIRGISFRPRLMYTIHLPLKDSFYSE